ncbi:DegQ family serine endoprotease [Devosia sp.]|uniref:DegQ family serine endoprotease n=1 Tax=Devosia sp. TaxID=1871048 RepID=UPI002EEC2397
MLKRLVVVAAASALIGVAASHFAMTLAQNGEGAPAPQPAMEAAAPRELPQSREQLQLSFAPVVKAVAPSVVNVYATTVTQQSVSPFANDPFFQRFFGGDGPFFQQRPRESQSLGSGVIVDPSGVVLTNSHVVNGATDIRISVADGREFSVDLVLDDPKTDLAVLRIRNAGGASFPAVDFGNSDALEVGDLVLAIGNPFGVGQTVTSGIVSALARTGVESSNYEFFIQTDAAINPGNSGGALVDLDGRLVGINTAIFTRSGGSIGIGFAIPANMARVVAQAGIAGGDIVRPWFGARLQDVTTDIANSLGLERPRGALITEIAPGSSAERAGFRPGDVILSADGFAVDQPSAFDFRLATKPVGSTVEIVYFRDGAEASVALKLEAPPPAEVAGVDGNTRFAGTTVETITAPVAQELGLGYNARGVVVRKVETGSPADRMGLRVGDIILSLNGRDIATAADFRSTANARPESWQIVLQRGGRVFRSFVSG